MQAGLLLQKMKCRIIEQECQFITMDQESSLCSSQAAEVSGRLRANQGHYIIQSQQGS